MNSFFTRCTVLTLFLVNFGLLQPVLKDKADGGWNRQGEVR
jgi:hypothetical protein